MFYIGLDQSEATAMIVSATAHLPIGESLGRVLAVSSAGILTDTAMFTVDVESNCTSRLVNTSGGLVERTRWRDGAELGRQVSRPGE